MKTDVNKILVTGAHGFIGRHVAKTAAQKGCRVIGVGHGKWDACSYIHWGISEWYEGSIAGDILKKCLSDVNVIFHCAGGSSVGSSISNPATDFERTVLSTLNVLEYVRANQLKIKIVYISSAAVYGAYKDELPIGTNYCGNPISPYGHHKKIAEELVRSYTNSYGIESVIVRLFSVYGDGLSKQLLWDACKKFSIGDSTFSGTGNEVRDWIHVKDVANLLLLASTKASSQCPVINGGSGLGVTVSAVLNLVSKNLGFSHKITFSGKARRGDPIKYEADMNIPSKWGWKTNYNLDDGVAQYVKWFLKEIK